jgi:hypothetical protein
VCGLQKVMRVKLANFFLTAEIAEVTEIKKDQFSAFSAASAVRYGFPETKVLNLNEFK